LRPRTLLRNLAVRVIPPYGRLDAALRDAGRRLSDLSDARDQLSAALAARSTEITALRNQLAAAQQHPPPHQRELRIRIQRDDRVWCITPDLFEHFCFRTGDLLRVEPPDAAAALPVTWGDVNILVRPGEAIRVPPRYDFASFRGFSIPTHLVALTGAGPETLDLLGRRHVELYDRFMGLHPDMTVLEVGCGIGRDAFQLLDFLGAAGRYIGVDVTRDSIVWCQNNITSKHPNFQFYHFDAENELYNPHGSKTSMDFALPVADGSVDRVVLASVFTHLFEEEVLHYLHEFARILKPDGQVYASFFLRTPEALAAASTQGTTPWKATFAHPLSDGVFGNDPAYPRGAVAFTDEAMRRVISKSGLRLVRPYLKGAWSGLHAEPDDGQDVAILARAR
jgi:ubiquinone/menaquinone biosynthesis C-methylase UbiE